MDYYFLLSAGLLGLILGSFINALLFRYNTGRSVITLSFGVPGRSKCMHCGHVLRALDLVPILSYLFLCGRCRYCYSLLSVQYPLVEVAGLVLGVLVYLKNPEPAAFALWLCFWMTLLFIFVYDLRHRIIPVRASVFLAALALLHIWSLGFGVWSFAAGPILAAPLLLLSLVSSGRWMGWGDGVLELGLGSMLGLYLGINALVLAFWIGAAVGIALAVGFKRYTMKSEVPFAPFLILGAVCSYFLNVNAFTYIAVLLS